MDRTHVVVEVLPNDPFSDRLLSGLNKAFDDLCPDLGCTVIGKRSFPLEPELLAGMRVTIKAATDVLLVEDRVTACLYLSPRRFDCVTPDKAIIPVSAMISAIATNERPIALFVHVIAANNLPEIITRTIDSHLEVARVRYLQQSTKVEVETAHRLTEAVCHGLSNALN